MDYREIIKIIIKIIESTIPTFKKFRNHYKFKRMGLKLFLALEDLKRMKLFEKMIDEARGGDEIVIIGRTLRWLIEKKRATLIQGLKSGLNFKLLILDPKKVKNYTIDLRPLQLKHPLTIPSDLAISVPHFISICNEAVDKECSGSFEVRKCDFVIFNSLISFTREKKRKIILDFSFTEDESDKYVQYYETKVDDEKHFCNKLHNFYKGFYAHSEFYIRYRHGKIERSQDLIEEDIDLLIQRCIESEKIRRNEVRNFLFAVPGIFNSIKDKHRPPYPISIQLELTNQCNVKCQHCKRYMWPTEGEMSTDRIKKLLAELASIRVQSITLSGGEPTLRPDFVEILRYAFAKGLRIGVLTNGLNIDGQIADVLIKCSDWVRISVDGSNKEVYGKVRGNHIKFERILESIKLLENAKNRHNRRNYDIGICYSIQKLNIQDVLQMIKFVRQLGLSNKERCLTFKFVHGRNGFLCSVPQLSDFYKDILEKEDVVNDKVTNLQYLKKFIDYYSNIQDISNGVPLNSYYRNNKIRCFTPYLFSLIDAFGDVYPCCFLYYDNDTYKKYREKREKYRMGNISDKPFGQIWLSEDYMNIRKNLEIIDIGRFPECKECTRHYLHNTFLTQLFAIYREIGDNENNLFRQILSKYSGQVVWL